MAEGGGEISCSSDAMSGVKSERADDERCGQPVGSYAWSKEPPCQHREGHVAVEKTHSL